MYLNDYLEFGFQRFDYGKQFHPGLVDDSQFLRCFLGASLLIRPLGTLAARLFQLIN